MASTGSFSVADPSLKAGDLRLIFCSYIRSLPLHETDLLRNVERAQLSHIVRTGLTQLISVNWASEHQKSSYI